MITKISSYITSYFEAKTYSAVKRFRSDALVEIFMEYCGLGKF